MLSWVKKWLGTGLPFIWLNAAAVSISVLMVVGLITLIAVQGLGHFWPTKVVDFTYTDKHGNQLRAMGEITAKETFLRGQRQTLEQRQDERPLRYLVKRGNRDMFGLDFLWVEEAVMTERQYLPAAMVVERREWGNFYGYLRAIKGPIDQYKATAADADESLWNELQRRIAESNKIFAKIRHIEKDLIGAVNYQMERLRLRERKLELAGISRRSENEPYQLITKARQQQQAEYDKLTLRLAELYEQMNQYSFTAVAANEQEVQIPLAKVVRAYRPNTMSIWQKMGFYVTKVWEFMTDEPREANTEGGVFPAIFGTVAMVMIMAVIVTPFGVVAAIYLHEYARQGFFTRLVRIAVNNLAGVPSIVYGVFGLGFFVYLVGGNIDKLFFPESLPAPVFGTPGLLWASITLALLTVPVVIVATEEGLTRVPIAIREGSLALGATKAETLWRTVLPMTTPSMMTGLILAVARAAGEVAPLMLVGVVKLAPTLPIDGYAPFLHLERKFMHLGFHIYDVGFQSPNVEAARPLVYATALLLVILIIILNLTAIGIRNTLREKYRAAEQY